jgi:NIPSNAP
VERAHCNFEIKAAPQLSAVVRLQAAIMGPVQEFLALMWHKWLQDLPMIIEMRTYKLKPGKRAQFLEVFRSKTMPAHAEIGMKILGPFLSLEDPDTFFFMRGFPDLPSREPMKAKFYEGELWKRELENVLMPMIDKYEVVLVDDPEGLVRW